MNNRTIAKIEIGQKFGKLTIVAERRRVRISAARPNGHIIIYYICECICGHFVAKDKYNLTHGRSKSCGCEQGHRVKHGMSSLSEYQVWRGMKARCNNPNHSKYYMYGARGVKVCKRWNEFRNFIADVGFRPSLDYSLDRYPDMNGNYEPDNVRWATRQEQQKNTRRNVVIVFNGRTEILAEWAREIGITANSLKKRLAHMSLARALTQPKRYPNV